MQYNTHILIVGAGPSGLTLACLLKKFGVPFFITTELVTLPAQVVFDENSDIYRAFQVDTSALYLIRPDRYIGWSA